MCFFLDMWQPDSQPNPPDSNGSTTQENSKYEQPNISLAFSFLEIGSFEACKNSSMNVPHMCKNNLYCLFHLIC